MLKNYNYVLTILLYPFILVLSYLKLTNLIKGELYTYLIIVVLLFFIPSFIMSLYNASEEILKSKKKWRIILLITLSIFYLPIYYTMYVAKEEKYLGYILFIITIPLTFITIKAMNNRILLFLNEAYKNSVSINEHYVTNSINNLFSIDVDASFRCKKDNIGDYVISCERLLDDSFIGVYSYDVTDDDNDELYEKIEFHVNQTIDYIKEQNFAYEINDDTDIVEISYNENIILITQKTYLVGNNKYSLIIIKEMPRYYISYDEYKKMIDSVTFLNYN
jgi:hypothetical protein